MSLTMAFIIGQYSHAFGGNDRCPRPGCRSFGFTSLDSEQQWYAITNIAPLNRRLRFSDICDIRFADARTQLPLPYRDDALNQSVGNSVSSLSCRKRKRTDERDDKSISTHAYKVARKERLCFKNIRLSRLPLPKTPSVGNVRYFDGRRSLALPETVQKKWLRKQKRRREKLDMTTPLFREENDPPTILRVLLTLWQTESVPFDGVRRGTFHQSARMHFLPTFRLLRSISR